jgi:hypothetical protein
MINLCETLENNTYNYIDQDIIKRIDELQELVVNKNCGTIYNDYKKELEILQCFVCVL